MITARRFYIDKFMKDNSKLFQGKILDIGGVRSKFRGNFKYTKVQEMNRKILFFHILVCTDLFHSN